MSPEAGVGSVAALRVGLLRDALRYGLASARDRVHRRPVETADRIPAFPDQLTPSYLTSVLCRDHDGAEVTDLRLGPLTRGTTARCSLRVAYNEAGVAADLPTALFVKASPDFRSRLIVGLLRALPSEATFYTKLRPELDIEAPRAYSVAFDLATARSMFILEDVATLRGAEFGHPVDTRVDRTLAESMVRQLATYHGTFWGTERLTAAGLGWLPDSLQWQLRANAGANFESRSMVGLQRGGDVVPPLLVKRRKELYPAFMRSLELNARGPSTLLHSDVHLGNWYVTPGNRMGQYDWQAMVRGQWALDFSYALTSALAVEDRRGWEKELLELYLEELGRHGVSLSFADAWTAYRQQIFHALVFWLYTLGAGRLQPDMQPRDAALENVRRMAWAAADLESFDSFD